MGHKGQPQVKNLREARPTWFISVPRLWEKVQERLEEEGKKKGGVARKALVQWARSQAERHYEKLRTTSGGEVVREALGYRMAKRLVFR